MEPKALAVFFVLAGVIIDKIGTKWVVTIAVICLEAAFLLLRFTEPSLPVSYVISALVGVASDACQLPSGISVREAFGSKGYSKKLGIVAAFVFFALAFGTGIMTMFYEINGNYQMDVSVFMIMGIIGTAAIHSGTKRASE